MRLALSSNNPIRIFIQVGFQSMADRYAYIPALGLFVILVWGFADFFETRSLGPNVSRAVCQKFVRA
jgi:hypothetical protein